jgi:Xaa-Pro aminopeptidase
MFSSQTYINRRKKLAQDVGDGVLLFIGNTEIGKNYKDNTFPFKQDSSLLYFCGINIPNIHLVIDIDRNRSILYGDDHGIDHTIWMGALPRLRDLADRAGIEEVKPLSELTKKIDKNTHFLPPYQGEHQVLLQQLTGIAPQLQKDKASEKFIRAIINQRSVKSEEEIEQMHDASRASQQMHVATIFSSMDGMFEYECVGKASQMAYGFNMDFSYPPILSKRGEILHNHSHQNELHQGDLVLFDGGCENKMGYAGDITRTWPIGFKCSTKQREIHDLVNKSYDLSVSMLCPDVKYIDVHAAAGRCILDGLKEIGLVYGDTAEAFEQGVHTLFFPHGLGHMIGLDVHDMENLGEDFIGYDEEVKRRSEFGWRSLRLGKRLQKDYCITVEPGIYFIEELIELRKSQKQFLDFVNYDKLKGYYDFGGMRVEDDYLITDKGSELLGIQVVRKATEIEEHISL